MRIRKLKLGQELLYPDEGGETVRCPVCEALWVKEDEHVSSPCEHLRFVYCTHDPGFVFFAGTWDHVSFEAAFQRLYDADDEADEMAAFKALSHPEVDAIVYWDWDDFPMVQWSAYWGYKTEKPPRTKASSRRRKGRG